MPDLGVERNGKELFTGGNGNKVLDRGVGRVVCKRTRGMPPHFPKPG
jgi:hypothetical protein